VERWSGAAVDGVSGRVIKLARGKVRRGILGGKRASYRSLTIYFTRASALVPVRVA
jgi:hypothetical protein